MPQIYIPKSFTADKAEEVNKRYAKTFPEELRKEIETLVKDISKSQYSKLDAAYIVAEFLNFTLADQKGSFSSQKYHHKSELLTLLEEPVKTLLMEFAKTSLEQLENPIQNLIKKGSLKELAKKSQILILLGDSHSILAQTDRELERAFNYYLLANELYPSQGQHPNALYKLAFCYEFGLGAKEDGDKAIRYYEAAALLGLAENQYMLGQRYESGDDIKKAIECYEKASEQDDIGAMLKLATIYKNGSKKILAKDEGKVLMWYEKAASLGDKRAAAEVVKIKNAAQELYELAVKTTDNEGLAFRYYQEASKSGHAGASHWLAKYYEKTPDNDPEINFLQKEESLRYYEKAQALGYAESPDIAKPNKSVSALSKLFPVIPGDENKKPEHVEEKGDSNSAREKETSSQAIYENNKKMIEIVKNLLKKLAEQKELKVDRSLAANLDGNQIINIVTTIVKVPEILATLKEPTSCLVGELVKQNKNELDLKSLKEINIVLKRAIGNKAEEVASDNSSISLINSLIGERERSNSSATVVMENIYSDSQYQTTTHNNPATTLKSKETKVSSLTNVIAESIKNLYSRITNFTGRQ